MRTREKLARREAAALKLQRGIKPRVEEWVAEQREAKRLARELGEMLENTREIQARATFARRVDPAGRDVEDDSVDGAEESEMVAYLDHLRREVGIK